MLISRHEASLIADNTACQPQATPSLLWPPVQQHAHGAMHCERGWMDGRSRRTEHVESCHLRTPWSFPMKQRAASLLQTCGGDGTDAAGRPPSGSSEPTSANTTYGRVVQTAINNDESVPAVFVSLVLTRGQPWVDVGCASRADASSRAGAAPMWSSPPPLVAAVAVCPSCGY